MNTLIPFFQLLGAASYPDDYRLFGEMEKAEIDGVEYWACRYTGTKDLQTGQHTIEDWLLLKASQTGIRKITVGAFYDRLGDKHPKLMALSRQQETEGVFDLSAALQRVEKSEYIDLDDQRLKLGMEQTGQFTAQELVALFADGHEGEVPEVLKLQGA